MPLRTPLVLQPKKTLIKYTHGIDHANPYPEKICLQCQNKDRNISGLKGTHRWM